MKKGTNFLLVLVFIVGLGIFSYPLVSNFYNDNFQTKVIDEYQKEIDSRSKEEIQKMLQDMTDYNKTLATGEAQPKDNFGDTPTETTNESGAPVVLDGLASQYGAMIGTLEVPSIKLASPIFSGVSDIQLQRGVGVMPNTSLPVGGESTHSVITGHRGLPTAKLFTDLPKVQVGDMFYIDILGEKLAYKVNEIKTIEPTDIGEMKIVPGQDIVTLLTCTPYMINSHRLLVIGSRVPLPTQPDTTGLTSSIPGWLGWLKDIPCCCWIILLLIILIIMLYILLSSINRKLKKIYDLELKKYEESKKTTTTVNNAPAETPIEYINLTEKPKE